MEWALEYSRYKLCSIQSLATLGKFNLSLLQYKIEILGKLMTVMEGWGLDPQDALDLGNLQLPFLPVNSQCSGWRKP